MNLEEITKVLVEAAKEGKTVVRLQSGDPSIFGAINEQATELAQEGVGFEVVPGVSSAFAAAAALGRELTVPELTQTVIFTRVEGRTPVPEKENLSELAKHNATLCIFLSVNMIDKVVGELTGPYASQTPVRVVYRASWPDQKIIKGTLGDIAKKIKEEKITRTAIVIISDVIDPKTYEYSKLYDKKFSHGYRKAKK